MPQKENNRAKNSQTLYWWGVGAVLVLSLIAAGTFIFGQFTINGYVLMVMILNIVVFGARTVYAFCHRGVLFSEDNYRATEEAVNAERVALYAFIVIFGAWLIEGIAENWVKVDDSIGDVGESVGLLILVAPVVTYLMSGYGKFRDIVREDMSDSEEKMAGVQSDL